MTKNARIIALNNEAIRKQVLGRVEVLKGNRARSRLERNSFKDKKIRGSEPFVFKQNTVVDSPNGDITVSFGFSKRNGAKGCPAYCVYYKEKPVLLDSPLGIRLTDGGDLTCGMTIRKIQNSAHDHIWKPLYAERSEIRDHYNEMRLTLTRDDMPGKEMELCFRAYDEGIAFCWSFTGPAWESVCIVKEETRFRFTGEHKTWTTYTAQGTYVETVLSEVKPGCERPLTVETDNGLYVALTEAKLVDYARMKLALDPELEHCIISELSGEVEAEGSFIISDQLLVK